MSSSDCSNPRASEDFSGDQEESPHDCKSHHVQIPTAKCMLERKKKFDCACRTETRQKSVNSLCTDSCRLERRKNPLSERGKQNLRNVNRGLRNEDISSYSDDTLSPVHRERKITEPPPARRYADISHRRAKTHGNVPKHKPGTKSNPPCASQNNTTASGKLLSARKFKIDDLRNQILDLERQLSAEQKENKILRNLYNRQQKELNKVQESRVEIPDLEKAHDEEIRVLKTLMRKVQEKNRELDSILKNKDDELHRRFNNIQSLKSTLQQTKRREIELEKRIDALKTKLQKQEDMISKLKENLNNSEKRLSEDRKHNESAKIELKNMKKKYNEIRKSNSELKHLKESAIYACRPSDESDQRQQSRYKIKEQMIPKESGWREDRRRHSRKVANFGSVLDEREKKDTSSISSEVVPCHDEQGESRAGKKCSSDSSVRASSRLIGSEPAQVNSTPRKIYSPENDDSCLDDKTGSLQNLKQIFKSQCSLRGGRQHN